ncbi:hypothetical protein [Streptomyces sp. C10-9-1]|uniref:hypothetical protein n=1 Tax=Streptomyces sp. C10-9-1 TaxID=1859285 RepID=UPI003F4A35A9
MTDETTRPAASPPVRRSDLADLVKARLEVLGISARSLAQRCIDPRPELQPADERKEGPLWTRSTLQNLINGEKRKAPTAAELRALAAGTGAPLQQIQDAAAAEYFDRTAVYSPDARARTLLHHWEEMSEADQGKILRLLESWKDV